MNDLISEFFIDIITRVIPGFIILALYPDKLFNSIFAEFQNIPILLIPGLIGAAWVIGFAIERATYVPFAFVISRFQGRNKRLDHLIEDHKPVDYFKTNNPELEKNFDYFKYNRRLGHKLAGDKIFCRVMCAISLGTCIWLPTSTLLRCGQWPSIRVLYHNVPCYGLFGAVVFGLAWCWIEYRNRNGN